jgi:hypothetical protein
MMSNSREKFLSILNLVGLLGTIIVNGLANTLPINNITTGELSDMYPNLFVPAGLTFAVWGVIYALLAVFIIFSLITVFRKNTSRTGFIRDIGWLFFISSLANIGWIFAWHYQILPLSVIIMLILLGSLIAIYLRLRIGKSNAAAGEKFAVHLPFSVYLGWITIATIANITALLVDVNWDRFGLSEQFWAVVMIAIGIALSLSILFTRQDIFYCLVVDWALLGILLKRLSDQTAPDQAVIITSIIGLVVISLGIIIQTIRRKVYRAAYSR